MGSPSEAVPVEVLQAGVAGHGVTTSAGSRSAATATAAATFSPVLVAREHARLGREPPENSATRWPGARSPRSRAARTLATAIRFFMLPVGLALREDASAARGTERVVTTVQGRRTHGRTVESGTGGTEMRVAAQAVGMLDGPERDYLETARLGRLATADADGRPHVVPVCFAVVDDELVTPVDEKPQVVSPTELRRIRDLRENPRVALVVDHDAEDWADLGWVQIRGTAAVVEPGGEGHAGAVGALRAKYDQYRTHALEERPVIAITPGTVRSWGRLARPDGDE